jgi:hypothetical protein
MSQKLLAPVVCLSFLFGCSEEQPLEESISASSVTPTVVSGNPTCASLGLGDSEFRVNSPVAGTTAYSVAGGTVTITINAAGQILDFTSTFPLDGVIVKGGTLANVYAYDPEASSDTGLRSPNLSNGNIPQISHFSICYDIIPCEHVVCDAPASECLEEGVCNPATNLCEYAPKASGTECRAANGVCDVAEVCDGSSGECPSDGYASAATECRGSAGDCDPAEYCTGSSTDCPADALSPSTTACRDADGACDVAEYCTGSDPVCPGDDHSTALCRPADGVCDAPEYCDGASDDCPADGYTTGGICRAADGICDVAEVCSGSSPSCPADGYVGAGTTCRGSDGICDVAEVCTGSSAACPSDGYVAGGTECRGSTGVCDVAELCTGSSADCPSNAYKPGGTQCRAGSGICDVAEACTGGSADCPSDGYVPAGTECRAAAGVCDTPEVCTGGASQCPADSVVGAGTTCRAAAGVCDSAEACNGIDVTCPTDGYLSGTTCRASANECDVEETCSGASVSCPADSGGSCSLCGNKFYDASADGTYDASESGISGWVITITGPVSMTTTTDSSGAFDFDSLPLGDYTVCESAANEDNWMQTAPPTYCFDVHVPSGDSSCDLDFGNLCLGAGGGHTPGFWSNRNGARAFKSTDGGAAALALLVSLNLANADGSAFNPANYNAFKTWLLDSTAVNMAYKLSTHLAAMELNVWSGFVDRHALVFAPGATGANDLGFIEIELLMNEANAALGADSYTPEGDANRAYQEALKNALDAGNNNLNFVQDEACAHTFGDAASKKGVMTKGLPTLPMSGLQLQ